jgi:hypothetical protein
MIVDLVPVLPVAIVAPRAFTTIEEAPAIGLDVIQARVVGQVLAPCGIGQSDGVRTPVGGTEGVAVAAVAVARQNFPLHDVPETQDATGVAESRIDPPRVRL